MHREPEIGAQSARLFYAHSGERKHPHRGGRQERSSSHHAVAAFFSFCLRAHKPPRFRGFLAAVAASPCLATAVAGGAAAAPLPACWCACTQCEGHERQREK